MAVEAKYLGLDGTLDVDLLVGKTIIVMPATGILAGNRFKKKIVEQTPNGKYVRVDHGKGDLRWIRSATFERLYELLGVIE